ncbi:hypothetical protein TNCV_3216781 [Trichonephila clavipes]|nr:hypothetical protein TNCV_3216781 [Trichonephila clavipes]
MGSGLDMGYPCSGFCNDLGGRLKAATRPVQSRSKYALLDSGLVIELVILFAPNRDPQECPQQAQFSDHYYPSE